jgi:hypothetical protein
MPSIPNGLCQQMYNVTHNPDIPQHTIDAAKKSAIGVAATGFAVAGTAAFATFVPPAWPAVAKVIKPAFTVGSGASGAVAVIDLYDKAKAYSELKCPLPKK